jgi:hypothetical protein
MIIIGIDPGKSGAVAVWNEGIDKVIKCPSDAEKMANIFSTLKTDSWVDGDGKIVAYIEQVHAFPTDARSSAFKFGKNYGEWIGVLGTLKIRTIYVTPQKWMKYYKEKLKIELPKDKQQRKRKLKEIAANYTDKKITLYNADAILIAVYGFITEQGG